MGKLKEYGVKIGGQMLDAITGGLSSSIGNQISYGLGDITGYNEKLRSDQVEMQRRLMDLQISGQKEMMDYQLSLNNPKAQVERLKEAGLNPALMYSGGSGGGGGSTVNQGSVIGSGASSEVERDLAQTEKIGMGLNLAKLRSEVALTEAQAENLRADTEKKRGVDTDKTRAEIGNILANTNNTQLKSKGQELDNYFNNIRNYIADETKDTSISKAQWESTNAQLTASKLVEETAILEEQKKVAKGTTNNLIRKVNAEVDLLFKDALLKEAQITNLNSQTSVNESEALKLTAEVDKIIQEIEVLRMTNKFKEADINVRREMIEAEIKKSWIQFGSSALNTVANIGTMFIPGGAAFKALELGKRNTVGYK